MGQPWYPFEYDVGAFPSILEHALSKGVFIGGKFCVVDILARDDEVEKGWNFCRAKAYPV